jgi:DNA-binding response OmpR family regulator
MHTVRPGHSPEGRFGTSSRSEYRYSGVERTFIPVSGSIHVSFRTLAVRWDMRVLLITPRTLAGFITIGLHEEGHVVDWIPPACAGQQYIRVSDYEAIIVDADLSGSDNVASLVAERQRPPLLALTGSSFVKPSVAARSGDGHLVKPFRFDELLKWLAPLTSRHSATQGT